MSGRRYSMIDVEKIMEAQRAFSKARKWERFHTPKNLAMALTVETAELLELFQWLTPQEARAVMRSPKKAKEVRSEMADVLYYLVRMADKLGVDLEESFWEKMGENKKKYPAHLARGNARKYTEL